MIIFLQSRGLLCPIPRWITSTSSFPSAVTFSGTLMQWDITSFGSTRRATAKARTPPPWIYHANKRPVHREVTQKCIKLQHSRRSLLQVFCPAALSQHNKRLVNCSLRIFCFCRISSMRRPCLRPPNE